MFIIAAFPDDLSDLLIPQGPPGGVLRYSQATVITWNPDDFTGTLDWRGITLTDVPVLASIQALGFQPNDVVGMLGWQPQGGLGSWWIIGRLAVPGVDSPNLVVRGSDLIIDGGNLIIEGGGSQIVRDGGDIRVEDAGAVEVYDSSNNLIGLFGTASDGRAGLQVYDASGDTLARFGEMRAATVGGNPAEGLELEPEAHLIFWGEGGSDIIGAIGAIAASGGGLLGHGYFVQDNDGEDVLAALVEPGGVSSRLRVGLTGSTNPLFVQINAIDDGLFLNSHGGGNALLNAFDGGNANINSIGGGDINISAQDNGFVFITGDDEIDMNAGTRFDLEVDGAFYLIADTVDGYTRVQVDSQTGSANARVPGTGAVGVFLASSARRFKNDLQDFFVNPRQVLRMQPKSWIDASEAEKDPDTTERHVGFVADELHELGLEAFVDYDDNDEPFAITYDRLCVALLEVAKDQQRRIDELTAWASENGFVPNEPEYTSTELPKRHVPHQDVPGKSREDHASTREEMTGDDKMAARESEPVPDVSD